MEWLLHRQIYSWVTISDIIAIICMFIVLALMATWAGKQTGSSVIGLIIKIIGILLVLSLIANILWGTGFLEIISNFLGEAGIFSILFILRRSSQGIPQAAGTPSPWYLERQPQPAKELQIQEGKERRSRAVQERPVQEDKERHLRTAQEHLGRSCVSQIAAAGMKKKAWKTSKVYLGGPLRYTGVSWGKFKHDTAGKSAYHIVGIFILVILIIAFVIIAIAKYNPLGLHEIIKTEADYLSTIGIVIAIIGSVFATIMSTLAILKRGG